MDGFDLFRKLGVGTKFDFKRFEKDADKLKVLPSSGHRKRKASEIRSGEVTKDAESDDDEIEEPALNEGENKSDDSGDDVTVLDGLQKSRVKVRKRSKQSFAERRQEKINQIRNRHRIHCFGTDVPEPCTTFTALSSKYNIHPQILQNISDAGYQNPMPIQMQAVPAMLQKRELLACAPTGSGKTAAFIIPILHCLAEPQKKGYRALVVAPTRELAKQIYMEFLRLSENLGFRIHYIEKATTEKKSKKSDILVSTPNRIVYMLQQDPPQINLNQVEWLVVDESDKLFEDGKRGFRNQLACIYKACTNQKIRRVMFSATFAVDVEQWCKQNLDNVLQIYIGAKNSATTTVEQELKFVGTESGKLLAVRDIITKGIQPPVLIFVQSKERAQELFHELIYDGMNVDVIHSDRTQEERDNVVKSFRSGKIWLLICTELLGRGIDFKGVNLVINYDFPISAISYIHRIGRTGRAGRTGKAVTFFTEEDSIYLRSIASVMKKAGCPVPSYILDMKRHYKKKRDAAKKVPKRDRISTISQYDLDKIKKRRDFMGKDKRKKNAKRRKKEG